MVRPPPVGVQLVLVPSGRRLHLGAEPSYTLGLRRLAGTRERGGNDSGGEVERGGGGGRGEKGGGGGGGLGGGRESSWDSREKGRRESDWMDTSAWYRLVITGRRRGRQGRDAAVHAAVHARARPCKSYFPFSHSSMKMKNV